MANKITTLFDFDTRGGVRSLSQLRTELKNTDTLTGKAKVALGGMGDMLKAHAAEGALAASAALATFAAKGVADFQNLAIESGKFADATGLSVEQASRWIEVAGDVGISGEQMQTVFLRLNKAIGDGSPVLEEYGIQAQKTADGQVDVNATMLEAIRRIGKIEDPTKRAAAAQKLFGRSYAEAAEIIFASADGVADKLAEVSDAKVIDERELEKARKFRALMDNLQDAIQDLSLAAGEYLVPILQDAGETIANLNEIIKTGTLGTNDLTGAIKGGLKVAMGDWQGVAEDVTEQTRDQVLATDLATTAINEAAEAARQLTTDALADQLDVNEVAMHGLSAQGDRYVETLMQAGQAQKDVNDRLAESKRRADEASLAIQDLNTDWKRYKRELSDRSALLDVSDAFDAVTAAAEAATEASKKGGQEAETANRDWERSIIDLKLRVGEYAEEVLNLPDASITVIQALIDNGKLAEAEAQLAWLSRGRNIPLTPKVSGPGGSSYFAKGTQNAPRGLAVVGEEGPELVAFRGGEKVFTAGQTRSMLSSGTGVGGGSTNVTINVSVAAGADPVEAGRQITRALEAFYRSGGRPARSA